MGAVRVQVVSMNGKPTPDGPAWITDDNGTHTLINSRSTNVITELTEETHRINVANGWFDDDRTFGDGIALLHSEVSEALEAYRDHGLKRLVRFSSADGYSLLPVDDPNVTRWQAAGVIGKPEGVASEYADIAIRLFDSCTRAGIDLEAEIRAKLAYNATRGHKHGGKAL